MAGNEEGEERVDVKDGRWERGWKEDGRRREGNMGGREGEDGRKADGRDR